MDDKQRFRVPKNRPVPGSIALLIAGLPPLVFGIIGVVNYARRGFVESRSGEPMSTLVGLVTYAVVILGGIGMIGYALWKLNRHLRHGTSNFNS